MSSSRKQWRKKRAFSAQRRWRKIVCERWMENWSERQHESEKNCVEYHNAHISSENNLLQVHPDTHRHTHTANYAVTATATIITIMPLRHDLLLIQSAVFHHLIFVQRVCMCVRASELSSFSVLVVCRSFAIEKRVPLEMHLEEYSLWACFWLCLWN